MFLQKHRAGIEWREADPPPPPRTERHRGRFPTQVIAVPLPIWSCSPAQLDLCTKAPFDLPATSVKEGNKLFCNFPFFGSVRFWRSQVCGTGESSWVQVSLFLSVCVRRSASKSLKRWEEVYKFSLMTLDSPWGENPLRFEYVLIPSNSPWFFERLLQSSFEVSVDFCLYVSCGNGVDNLPAIFLFPPQDTLILVNKTQRNCFVTCQFALSLVHFSGCEKTKTRTSDARTNCVGNVCERTGGEPSLHRCPPSVQIGLIRFHTSVSINVATLVSNVSVVSVSFPTLQFQNNWDQQVHPVLFSFLFVFFYGSNIAKSARAWSAQWVALVTTRRCTDCK